MMAAKPVRRHRAALLVALLVLFALPMTGAATAAPTRSEGSARSAQVNRGGQVVARVTVRTTTPPRSTAPSRGSSNRTTNSPPSSSNRSSGRTTSSRNLVTYHWRAGAEGCFLGRRSGSGWRGGIRYEYVRVDNSRRPPREEVIDSECRDPSSAPTNRARRTTPPRPAPPSIAELTQIARARISPPRLAVSPRASVGGVTGLETHFWYEGQASVAATASIRGYTTRATMRPVSFRWATGDGGHLRASRAGSERSPAATWIYESRGRFTQRLDVVWSGTWTFSGHGASASGTLDDVTATATQFYRVDEIRGELREAA